MRQPNGGPGRARNEGAAPRARPLVAFLDADDVWLPRKLERQVAYFDRVPGDRPPARRRAREPRADAHARSRRSTTLPLDERRRTRPRRSYCDLFHGRLDINTLTVMAPRDVLLECGGFDERRELHVEDWDLWLRIAARHPVGYLPCRSPSIVPADR